MPVLSQKGDVHWRASPFWEGSLPLAIATLTGTMPALARLSAACPDLAIDQMFRFITLASKLKDDILLVQPSSVPLTRPPDILPPTIMVFLQKSCNMTENDIVCCWDILKSVIWYEAGSFSSDSEEYFAQHGHIMGLCMSVALSVAACGNLTSFRLTDLVSASAYMPQSIMHPYRTSAEESRTKAGSSVHARQRGDTGTLEPLRLKNRWLHSILWSNG